MSTETETPNLLRRAQRDELCDWTHTNRTLRHVPSAATMPEDLLVPAYWSLLARELTQNNVVLLPAPSLQTPVGSRSCSCVRWAQRVWSSCSCAVAPCPAKWRPLVLRSASWKR